ncbi:MAG: hypothetical protein ABIF77_19625 [bacterium]
MASTTKKWLVGCGIGCTAMIVIAGLLGVGGVFLVRNIVDEFKTVDAELAALQREFGEVTDFRPEPAGEIPPARLESFLEVRRLLEPARQEMSSTLDLFAKVDRSEYKPSPWEIIKLIKNGIGLVPAIGRFYLQRNESLQTAGMGLGEYHFLYVVIYYSWLGYSPADGPPFTLLGDEDEGEDDEEIGWECHFGDEDEEWVRERREERLRKFLNPLMRSMLRHQLDDLTGTTAESASDAPGASRDWQQELRAEIDALSEDDWRLPWEDGLPEIIENSLRPYRETLMAGYDKLCNPLELGPPGCE